VVEGGGGLRVGEAVEVPVCLFCCQHRLLFHINSLGVGMKGAGKAEVETRRGNSHVNST
jgi:hypothetical protein